MKGGASAGNPGQVGSGSCSPPSLLRPCSFAWAVAESSLIFSGLCYNGRTAEVGRGWGRVATACLAAAPARAADARAALKAAPCCHAPRLSQTGPPLSLPQGRPLWNRYINSRIRRVEFNPSLPNLAANWNVCTGLWLRHCEANFPGPKSVPVVACSTGCQAVR